MARYDKGACGHSGKVGPGVGTFDNDIVYLRSNPRKTKNREQLAWL